MVCDATYMIINEIEDELVDSRKQHGFKDEREYLAFLLNIEKVWEQDHLQVNKPEDNNSG